eukprot:365325-Chlamydomonas_euryale.AAC.15
MRRRNDDVVTEFLLCRTKRRRRGTGFLAALASWCPSMQGSIKHERSVWGAAAAVAGVSPHMYIACALTAHGLVSLQSAAPKQASMRPLMHGLRPSYSARGYGASQAAGFRPAHQTAGGCEQEAWRRPKHHAINCQFCFTHARLNM